MGELALIQREQVRLQGLNVVLADQVPVGKTADVDGTPLENQVPPGSTVTVAASGRFASRRGCVRSP